MKKTFKAIMTLGLLSTGLPLFSAAEKTTLSTTRERDDSNASTMSIHSARLLLTPSPGESTAEKPFDISFINMDTFTVYFSEEFDFNHALGLFYQNYSGKNPLAKAARKRLANGSFTLQQLHAEFFKVKDCIVNLYLEDDYRGATWVKPWRDCELAMRLLLKATLLKEGLYSAAIKYLKNKGHLSFDFIGMD